MKENPNYKHDFWKNVSNYVNLFSGSSVMSIGAMIMSLRHHRQQDQDVLGQHLFFDWQTRPSSQLISLLDCDIHEILSPDHFVTARLPENSESLRRAEEAGLFASMPAGWHRNTGSSGDNHGGAADPRIGLILALLNEPELMNKLSQSIQKATEHDRKIILAQKGLLSENTGSQIVIMSTFSTAGATGNGSQYWFTRNAANRIKQEQGIQAKVILNALLTGTIAHNDRDRAELNELALLKFLRPQISGKNVNPITGQLSPCQFDQLFLAGNQNDHGNIAGLDQLLAHQAHTHYLLWHTDAGRKIRERLVDFSSCSFDEYGDPQFGLSMSCSIISCDSERRLGHAGSAAAELLIEHLLAAGDRQSPPAIAANLARSCDIIESAQDNNITGPLLQHLEPGQTGFLEQMREMLADRLGKSRGLQRIELIDETVNDIRSQHIPEVLAVKMKKKARKRLETAQKHLDQYLQLSQRKLHGTWQARQSLGRLRKLAENSYQVIMAKIAELQAMAGPHEQNMVEILETAAQFQNGRFWHRLSNPLLPGRMSQLMEESARIDLECLAQTTACTIAAQEFLLPFVEYVDTKIAWLTRHIQKLQNLKSSFGQKVRYWTEKPTVTKVPLGLELTDREFLKSWFAKTIIKLGGEEQFVQDILARYLADYDSLAFLSETPEQQARKIIIEICTRVFAPLIKAENVVDIFKDRFPQESGQRRIIQESILQCEGRVLSLGEVNKKVAWLKHIIVPDTAHQKWAQSLCEGLDTKPGKWDSSVHHDPDLIIIMQLRNNISLTPLIKRLEAGRSWSEIISRAPDPVSALMVNSNPTDREIKRLWAKAIAADLLDWDPEQGLTLHSCDQDQVFGGNVDSAHHYLRHNWSEIVFIESTFGRHAVIREKSLLAALHRLKSQLQDTQDTQDMRLILTDLDAVEEAIEQLELITPWARRQSQAGLKELKA